MSFQKVKEDLRQNVTQQILWALKHNVNIPEWASMVALAITQQQIRTPSGRAVHRYELNKDKAQIYKRANQLLEQNRNANI